MAKLSAAILLSGLMAAGPVWAQALTPEAQAALGSALQDERNAEAFYGAVLTRFGEARPFSNIIAAERQHEALLIGLYETYGVAVPENAYATGALQAPLAPDNLIDACKIGIDAELANRDLYDGNLLPAVADYPDITRVLRRLRDASEENHLPAFQRCVARG